MYSLWQGQLRVFPRSEPKAHVKEAESETDTFTHTSYIHHQKQCWQAYSIGQNLNPYLYITLLPFFSRSHFFHSLYYLFTPTFKHWFSSRQFFYGACACVCVHAHARVCLQTCLIDVRACCEAVSLSPCRTDVPAWLCGFTSAARLLKNQNQNRMEDGSNF